MGKSLRFAIEFRSMAKTQKTTPIDDQGKIFIDAARELGCDEDPAHFEEKLKKVARHKPAQESKPSPPDKQKKKS